MHPRRVTKHLAFLSVVVLNLSLAVSIYSQVTGATLSGTVSDSSGAVIPGAEISIKNAATGIIKKVVADSVGYYTAPDLAPGTYNFTVESCTTDFSQSQTLQLTPGMQADLEVQVLGSIGAWGCYDPNTFYIRQIPPQRAQFYFTQVRYVGPR